LNFLVGILPEALKTNCEKCTRAQKSKALKVITKLYYEHPKIYISLAEKYDATGKYTKRFEDWFDEQEAQNELHESFDKKNNSETSQISPNDAQGDSTHNNVQINRRESENKSEGPTKISFIIASASTTTQKTTVLSTNSRSSLRTTPSTSRSPTTRNPYPTTQQRVFPFKLSFE
jgi:hypothetical protein